MISVEQLNSRFSVADVLTFASGNGGLIKAVMTTPEAAAEVYLHGAHVAHFQPTGQAPVLFMSDKSNFTAGKAIRGGVPICFPWFGSLAGHPEAPAHGFARTTEWSVLRTRQSPGGALAIDFGLESNGDAGMFWAHPFRACYSVSLEPDSRLVLRLKIENTGATPLLFEEALHSYFHVSDVRDISVNGLGNTVYLDKLQSNREITGGPDPISIVGETDRVYQGTTKTCEIHDAGFSRTITVMKDGSDATVLWNPWIAKAKAMADFGDDEWPAMLCIETCNVGKAAVTLGPGESHSMTAAVHAIPAA